MFKTLCIYKYRQVMTVLHILLCSVFKELLVREVLFFVSDSPSCSCFIVTVRVASFLTSICNKQIKFLSTVFKIIYTASSLLFYLRDARNPVFPRQPFTSFDLCAEFFLTGLSPAGVT